MKAALFYKKHDLRVENVEVREPDLNELVINVKACGVCGTDIHIYNGEEGSVKVIPPLILGHELSGVVYKAAREVKRIKVGDRVCVDPNSMCDECYYCRNGQKNFCENHVGLGTNINGGFAEYITVKEKDVYIIPDSISFEEAAMVEPISCCLNGIDLTQIEIGDTVLIIGGGPIGLMMVQLAKYCGASTVILSEPIEWKRTLGLKLGADIAINPISESVLEVINNNKIKNINKTIECVGLKETILDAIKFTSKGGIAMLFGLTEPSAEISLKPFELFRKQLTIKSSFINPYTTDRALSLLASGRIKVKELITDIIELDDINIVFEDSSYRKKGKIIIKIT